MKNKEMVFFKYMLLILANSAGVLVSMYSLFFTEKLNNFILPDNLICDINSSVSCSTTYISGYAFIFNVPISLFALLFFWFVLSFLIMNRNKKIHVQSYQILSIINTVALLCCAYFLYVLIFILKNTCISCLLIDLIVLLNFILLFNYLKRTFNTHKLTFSQLLKVNWLFVLSFVVLFFSGLVLYKTYQLTINNKNKELLEAFFQQEPKKDIACNNSIFWGDKNSKIKIRIFSDFLCGYCKLASERYRQIFSEDTSVCIEFICYPLKYGKTNEQNSPNINVFLSKVMLSASHEREFWDFHDLVIKKSDNLDSTKIFEIAEFSLSNFEGFKENFSNKENDILLDEHVDLAKGYKVTGTPTIFINGRGFEQWTNINLLMMIVTSNTNKKL